MKPENVKKILIVKLCCLGDIVFVTPVINSLRKAFPTAHISILISDWVKPLMEYVDNIDEIILFNAPFEETVLRKIAGTIKTLIRLRKEKFDLGFLAHRNNFFGRLLMLSGIRNRMGFKDTAYVNLPAKFNFKLKETDRYLKILEESGVKTAEKFPSLIQKKNIFQLRSENNIPNEKTVIGIFPFGGTNPGTQMNIKRWDLNKYFKLIEKFKNQDNIHIVLFEGTKADEKISDVKNSDQVTKTEITFDYISACDVFVSGDTGPLHIAAAFGIKTLALFGPSDPSLVAPTSHRPDHHKYVFKNVECSPCYTPETSIDTKNTKYWKNGTFICHTGTLKCLKEITIDDVYNPLMELINLSGENRI